MNTGTLLSEGIASVRRVPGASIVGALLTAISLSIAGGFLLITLGYQKELDRARASAVVEVFLADSISQDQAEAIAREIGALPEVLSTHVRSPREGAALFGESVTLDTSITGGDLPIPTTIRVDLREESLTTPQVETIRSKLNNLHGVEEAAFASDLLRVVEERLRLFTRIAILVGSLLLLGVIGVVAVTAQLTVVTRRSMIRTMRLLGAERRWIVAPFLLQGFLIGLLGGGLALLALWGAGNYIPETASTIESSSLLPWLLLLPLFGGTLGLCGSGIASGYTLAGGKKK